MKKLILIGLLLVTSHVFAKSAATVLFTEKKVVANRNGVERSLARGAALEPGDEVVTSNDAAANIQYANGTLVNIGANSNYKILVYAPKADVQIQAQLNNGKIEIQTPSKIKETLKTPIVSLAILGTNVRVDVPSGKMTYIQVIEGLVLARTEYLRPGDSVRVTGDHIVSAPFPKEGVVASPLNAPGKIESGTSTTTTSSTDSQETGTNDISTTSTVSTTQTVAAGTTSGTDAVSMSAMATISVACG